MIRDVKLHSGIKEMYSQVIACEDVASKVEWTMSPGRTWHVNFEKKRYECMLYIELDYFFDGEASRHSPLLFRTLFIAGSSS